MDRKRDMGREIGLFFFYFLPHENTPIVEISIITVESRDYLI